METDFSDSYLKDEKVEMLGISIVRGLNVFLK